MDSVRRFLFEQLDIRGALVQLGPAWQAMHEGRGYAPPVGRMLGELAAVAALISTNLKTPGRLTFHLQGNGPVRLLVMDCDQRLRLRGLAKAAEGCEPATLANLLGDGRLALTLDSGSGSPYQSIVPIHGDDIAGVFEHYLAQSEQSPTRLWLAADDSMATGLFLQKLPTAETRDADGWNRVQQLAATVRGDELALPAEQLLPRLFPEDDVRLFAPQGVSYHCPRNEAKVVAMLKSLGRDELASLLDEHGEIVVHDDICNHEYRFGPRLIDQLFGPRTLH